MIVEIPMRLAVLCAMHLPFASMLRSIKYARPPTIPSYAVPYMQNVVTKKEQRQSHAKALKQEMNGAHLLVHAMYLYDATGASSRRSR